MFKILKWISPSTGKYCEAMMPVSKLEPILEILQQKPNGGKGKKTFDGLICNACKYKKESPPID